MIFEIQTHAKDGFVLVSAEGPATEANFLSLARAIRQACEAEGVRAAMIDCQAIEGSLTTSGLYEMVPKFVRELGPGLRVAYINPPAAWTPEDIRFSQDVAANVGGQVQPFGDEAEAAAWLTASRTEPAQRDQLGT